MRPASGPLAKYWDRPLPNELRGEPLSTVDGGDCARVVETQPMASARPVVGGGGPTGLFQTAFVLVRPPRSAARLAFGSEAPRFGDPGRRFVSELSVRPS